MAERLARLACSLAAWRTVLFLRASSMAPFLVKGTAVGVVAWGWGASCAWTDIVRGRSRATWTPKRRRIDFAPGLGLFFMHASFLRLQPQKRRPFEGYTRPPPSTFLVTQGFDWLQAGGIVGRQVAKKESGGTRND